MAKKTIVVVGATGMQGGGLVRAILTDPNGSFQARALTRNDQSEKAAALAQGGAEVVRADLDDLESLKQAFKGAYGAFCVTNFWEHFSPEKEVAQAANMAEAAKEAGLEHVIWSTLEDTRQWVPLEDERMPTLMDKYKVPHFDAKAEANREFINRGVPTTLLLTTFYWENFFGMAPKRDFDGVLALALPMGDHPLGGIAAEDIGRCAYGIFKQGKDYVGKTVGIAGEFLTGAQMVSALTDALGKEVRYNAVPPEIFRTFGFPGAEDMGNMFQFYQDFSEDFMAARDLERARALNPSLQTFKEWLSQNKNQIPLE